MILGNLAEELSVLSMAIKQQKGKGANDERERERGILY